MRVSSRLWRWGVMGRSCEALVEGALVCLLVNLGACSKGFLFYGVSGSGSGSVSGSI